MASESPRSPEAELLDLLEAARVASRTAYCDYSGFPVGAALKTVGGARFVGCNVENASHGLTVCAERVAIFGAVAAGELERHRRRGGTGNGFVQAMAVSCAKGEPGQPESLMPCGACRQVMAEFLAEDARILVDGVGRFTLSDLLPRAFTLPRGFTRPRSGDSP